MNNLKELRKLHNLSQSQFAKEVGVAQNTVSNWENGNRLIDAEMLQKISSLFHVSTDYILGITDNERNIRELAFSKIHNISYDEYTGIRIPVLGYVAAGIPIEAIEDVIDYEDLDTKAFNPNYEYFGLKIKGDSMTPRIQDGDVVIVRRQPDVESGEIAIVCVNGDNATCKQIKKQADGISLIPFNPAYDIKFYTNKEVSELPITILGKVVELRGKF